MRNNFKAISKIIEILENKKYLVRGSRIFNGEYYKKEQKKGGFWGNYQSSYVIGASIFRKAKEIFTKEEEDKDLDGLAEETKQHIVWISALEYVTKEIMNHIAQEELGNIQTHK